jgi:dihydroneopterin aldolase
MSDRITVTGIRGLGRHGWFAFETEQGQEFVVDVVLDVDHTAAAASDDLADTVDYGVLGERVVALIEGGPYKLIETLATRIAEACLEDRRVARAEVTVHKPQAPMPVPFGDVAVTVERGRRP